MTLQTRNYLLRLTLADRDKHALALVNDPDGPGTSPELGEVVLALRELFEACPLG